MEIKNTFKFIFVLALLACPPAYAYVIYNQTSKSVQVEDNVGFRGLKMAIPAYSSTACNPNAGGCSGRMAFEVYSTNFSQSYLKCGWKGVLPKGSGNYFVITDVGQVDDEVSPCKMEYFHE